MKIPTQHISRWGILFHSKNRLDGLRTWIGFHNLEPLLFYTRKETQTYINANYNHYKSLDLRQEPHGWRMPRPIRLKVSLIPTKAKK